MDDAVIATAILDRLLHHSHVTSFRGVSYRLREKKRAGLFGTQARPEISTEQPKAYARGGWVNSKPAEVGHF